MSKPVRFSEKLAWSILALFALDRAVKMLAISHFFARPKPADPSPWPTVTLLQPISHGASDLRAALAARARLDYPGTLQHLLVCDVKDEASLVACREWADKHPALHVTIVVVPEGTSSVSSKTTKLIEGVKRAEGEIVCSVDDDIILRPDALRVLVPYLGEPGVGAAFGLACYTGWHNLPTSLMSIFVNSNALLSYIPLAYLVEPFTITGHVYAVKRKVLNSVGGFQQLEKNIGDDHELAQRIRRAGLRIVQTPLVYDVENYLGTLHAYAAQMKRWFVFPRQALLPNISNKEQLASLIASIGSLLPGVLAALALITRRRSTSSAFLLSLGLSGLVYATGERLYLKRTTALRQWSLVLLMSILSPAQVAVALVSNNDVEWRGKRLRIKRGGWYEELDQ